MSCFDIKKTSKRCTHREAISLGKACHGERGTLWMLINFDRIRGGTEPPHAPALARLGWVKEVRVKNSEFTLTDPCITQSPALCGTAFLRQTTP